MAEKETATKEKLDFSTLENRLAELDATAFMRAERECRMAADPAPDITYSSAFRAKLAAAAMGVLTPMPCVPLTVAPWVPGVPTILVCGKPLLNNTSKLMCSYGGVIQVTFTPALTVQTP